MMRLAFSAALCAAALTALPACSFADMHETVHQSVPAPGISTVQVSNTVGGVTVRTWDKPQIDIVARKSAHSTDALRNIGITVASHDGTLSIATVYKNSGGGWNNGGVGYTITVPAGMSLNVTNETGGIRIDGVSGNVVARATTGGIEAQLGRVSGNRNVDMQVVTGGIRVSIARNSDATLDLHTTVGGVKSAFSGDRIGTGSGHVRLQTTTGGVELNAT